MSAIEENVSQPEVTAAAESAAHADQLKRMRIHQKYAEWIAPLKEHIAKIEQQRDFELSELDSRAALSEVPRVLRLSISELRLSVRTRKCMVRLGVKTVGDLVSKTAEELLAVRNFGEVSLHEVEKKLRVRGLWLRPVPDVYDEEEGMR